MTSELSTGLCDYLLWKVLIILALSSFFMLQVDLLVSNCHCLSTTPLTKKLRGCNQATCILDAVWSKKFCNNQPWNLWLVWQGTKSCCWIIGNTATPYSIQGSSSLLWTPSLWLSAMIEVVWHRIHCWRHWRLWLLQEILSGWLWVRPWVRQWATYCSGS